MSVTGERLDIGEGRKYNPRMEITGSHFPTTKWGVVIGLSGDRELRNLALAELCREYWPPLYTSARISGLDREDARDVVQSFTVHLIEKQIWESADPERGRMRAFLAVSLRYFIAQWRRHQRAEKRGGGSSIISWDEFEIEERYFESVTVGNDPGEVFDRRWAECLLERADRGLRKRYLERGKAEDFDRMIAFVVPGSGRGKMGTVAREMGVSEEVLRTRLVRMRAEYGDVVRELVRETLIDESAVEDELQILMRAFG